jgi:hypothetical protein
MTPLVRALAALHLLAALGLAGLGTLLALASWGDLDDDPWADVGLYLGGIALVIGAAVATVAAVALVARQPGVRLGFAAVTGTIGLLICAPFARDPLNSVQGLVVAPSLALLVVAVVALRTTPSRPHRA